MVTPTMLGEVEPGQWVRHLDPRTGHTYLYNESTGESKWAGTAVEEVRSALRGTAGSLHAEPPAVREAEEGPAELEMVALEGCEDDDEAKLQEARVWRGRGMVRTIRYQRQSGLTWHERACDRLLLVLEGCCCETPAALVEAAVRVPFYLGGAACLFLLSGAVCLARGCAFKKGFALLHRSFLYLREALLLAAAALTIALPCCVFSIYKEMPADDGDWDVAPIPTLLGSVDPRRFYTFHLGRASLANNRDYDERLPSLDTWPGRILHIPNVATPAPWL